MKKIMWRYCVMKKLMLKKFTSFVKGLSSWTKFMVIFVAVTQVISLLNAVTDSPVFAAANTFMVTEMLVATMVWVSLSAICFVIIYGLGSFFLDNFQGCGDALRDCMMAIVVGGIILGFFFALMVTSSALAGKSLFATGQAVYIVPIIFYAVLIAVKKAIFSRK